MYATKSMAYFKPSDPLTQIKASGYLSLEQISVLKKNYPHAYSTMKHSGPAHLVCAGKLTFDLLKTFTYENSLIFSNTKICLLALQDTVAVKDLCTLNLTELERITYDPTFEALKTGACTLDDAKKRELPHVYSENDPHYRVPEC